MPYAINEGNLINLLKMLPIILYLTIIGMFNALIPNKWKFKKDVNGKIVLITGAGQGLGRLYALNFADLQCKIILWDINEDNLKEVVKECRLKNAQVSYQVVDVSQKKQIYESAKKVLAEYGFVDILVNNAGILFGKEFMDLSDDNFEMTLKVNTISHWYILKAFLPSMIEKNEGHIVSMCSISSFVGTPWGIDYTVSKFGAIGIMEGIRNELKMKGIKGIKMTCVAPIFTRTAMIKNFKISQGVEALSPHYVVDQAMDAILTNQPLIILPKLLYFLYFLKGILPTTAFDYIVINSLA
ncbi:Epidermal retinol dehydrogenase 2 [Strongyloides ratti]|uniref:Short-chain dehydrogenase/reductase 3 n=1 Tax=Strongyloides ratti TaxID=34506 RepID=A0A090MWC3_STRRB|nr:Epidermal retinol dehydrogenase 2 [Strongyloides ratti]CEF63619.1 Epidermal retinol dehydrogenase 2 [Strongyloides ratti]